MKAYKATNKDMICSRGNGDFQYQFGLNRAETAKTRKSGLHFTEDPFLALDWYPLGCGNRYFLCEALGDISEEKSDNTMSCTELIIMEELSLKALAGHGMMYMIDHPLRSWVKTSRYLNVKKEQAAANCAGAIAIARGIHPKVKGPTGSYLGLIEERNGIITGARLLEPGKSTKGLIIKENTWYALRNGKIVEIDE